MASDHTALKLPQFWPKAEVQFNVHRITSDLTKYSYVVVALDEDTSTRVLDILIQPTATHKYTTLKDRLVEFRWSDWEAAAKILEEELGDTKPSELMDKMLALVPPPQEIFLHKLPP
uniref:DUF7041 domain-containing protein n=1 Tax=Octopus bimaculoides TaxID=37653 RepID=A0A0L8H6I7_OCTBM